MWLAGFVISVVFSFLAALGINLQKHSMHLDEVAGSDRPAMRQPMWVTGFVLILLGSILDFVAFGLAPQVSVAVAAEPRGGWGRRCTSLWSFTSVHTAHLRRRCCCCRCRPSWLRSVH